MNIYTLYSCDAWRTTSSMSVAFKTADESLLAEVIFNAVSNLYMEGNVEGEELEKVQKLMEEEDYESILDLVEKQHFPHLHLESEDFDPETGLFGGYQEASDVSF